LIYQFSHQFIKYQCKTKD